MIRLRFVCQDQFSSNLIAWFSSGHFSHVDCILPDGTLLGARSDAVGGRLPGVFARPADYLKSSSVVVFTLAATPAQEEFFYAFLRMQIGKPYDKLAIIAFLVNRNWRDMDSWMCSELQAAALEAAGICPPLYLAANKITPVALALVTSALGATTEVLK